MDLRTYQKRVDAAFATWVRDGQSLNSLAPLAVLLGCRHLEAISGRLHYRNPDQPAEPYELIVRQTLLELLARHEAQIDSNTVRREQAILDGLLRNNRWRGCLNTIPTAYRFTALLANFHDNDPGARLPSPQQALRSAVAREIAAIIPQWCGVDTATVKSKRELAAILFGDAWATLILDSYPPETMLADVLDRTHPCFLPGLVPAQVEYAAQDLPPLIGSAV